MERALLVESKSPPATHQHRHIRLTKAQVSDYLKAHAPEDLYDNLKSPFAWSRGAEGKTYYQLLEEDTAFSDVWHKGMAQAAPFNPVLGMFPFRDMRAAVEAEPDRAFVVDVGGGRGNALIDMMRECGGSFGAPMVLQDMKEVLQGDDPVRIEGVQVMPHDFYNEQPVKSESQSVHPRLQVL